MVACTVFSNSHVILMARNFISWVFVAWSFLEHIKETVHKCGSSSNSTLQILLSIRCLGILGKNISQHWLEKYKRVKSRHFILNHYQDWCKPFQVSLSALTFSLLPGFCVCLKEFVFTCPLEALPSGLCKGNLLPLPLIAALPLSALSKTNFMLVIIKNIYLLKWINIY